MHSTKIKELVVPGTIMSDYVFSMVQCSFDTTVPAYLRKKNLILFVDNLYIFFIAKYY